MNKKSIMRVFRDTSYVRMGGTDAELKCAQYLKDYCAGLGCEAVIEPFEVPMGKIACESLTVDGEAVPCKGYMLCGSGSVSAPLYYLTGSDKYSLSLCRDKIVLIDGYLGRWMYHDVVSNGAAGIITYDGHVNYSDRDIDARELRQAAVGEDKKLLCVNINVKDAVRLIKNGVKNAEIRIEQDEYTGQSQNVVLELKGSIEDVIALTAHYDSTSLSKGAYDNMSGSAGLMAMAEYFSKNPHRYTLRFIWCGSEERGLLGSKAYCATHESELERIKLNINLDMIGSAMGKFIACCTSEEKLVGYIEYMSKETGFGVKASQDVYSSDSTPFADRGIPAVSFARIAPNSAGTIHNSYDTSAILSADSMVRDIEFITAFTSRMANAAMVPVEREMPESMKEKLDIYLLRKRDTPKLK